MTDSKNPDFAPRAADLISHLVRGYRITPQERARILAAVGEALNERTDFDVKPPDGHDKITKSQARKARLEPRKITDRVEVTVAPAIEKRHGVEVGDVYDATDGAKTNVHTKGPRKGMPKRSDFLGSVWIRAKGSGERVRLMPSEFRYVDDDPKSAKSQAVEIHFDERPNVDLHELERRARALKHRE